VEGKGIYVADKISLAPGVVLDASEGPIFLGEQVKIMPNAVIMGPAAIGKGSLVKIGAKIYGGTSIGPFCKVGGEIEGTIIQGYSNKQHEGFLGHAYIGEWCNIGAGTENSDLKNNYTQVKVQIGDKRVNSGKLKVGLFMGDHCKTGINTTFNTGSVMGVASMAFGAGFQPQYIPSFHWSDGGKLKKADLDSTIETSKVVMSRRGIEISAEEIEILRYIYKNSGQIY
jgi:UDP-N-acetylglucosamine diphosphorylase/glucosamine-1-phosphate N-acetyltransferase